jgi:signal transduction histidine kinase/CheY-like chemotaxis protein
MTSITAAASASSRRTVRRSAFVLGGLLGAVLLTGFAATAWVAYFDQLAEAKRETQTLAVVFDAHAQQAFHGADLILRIATRALGSLPGSELASKADELGKIVGGAMADGSQILGLAVIGPTGERVVDTMGVTGLVDVNAPYFAVHRDGPAAGVVFSEPPAGRTGRDSVLVASRRLDRADGSFAGIVAVTLALDRFLEVFRTLAISHGDTVTLRDRRGTVLARYPQDVEPIGKEDADLGVGNSADGDHSTLAAAVPLGSSNEVASFRAIAGTPFVRAIAGTPFVISVGPSGAGVAEGWRRDTTRYAVVMLALLSIIAALILGVGWQIRRRGSEARQASDVLSRVQKMDAVGRLTGGVAHDFNNLLTVILGNSSLLVDRQTTPALRRLAQMIEDAALRGAELTHRLLAFARLQPLQPVGLDLNALVAGMEGLLRRTLGEDVEIVIAPDASLPLILADAGQVESALLNLVNNSRDAMPTGGRLTIATAQAVLDPDYARREGEIEPGRYAMLTVTDTGTGMAPEILRRVFEPFFTTKDIDKGAGLGLSVTFGFAKQSGGHIAIQSEVGIGTTVRLYLPLATEQDRPAAFTTELLDTEVRPDETVLVVEDDEAVRVFAATFLRSLGYAVHAAGDGPEALAILATPVHVDLLFTDVVMPKGMNGRQLAEQAMRRRPTLRVLYTSGYTADAISNHGRLDAGAQILRKPYRSGELALRVRTALAAAPPAA